MNIDYARCYHQGVRVPDLEVAMAELGAALSLHWCEPQVRDQAVWLPDSGATSPAIRCSKVDLPAPVAPTTATVRPDSIWASTPASTSRSPS